MSIKAKLLALLPAVPKSPEELRSLAGNAAETTYQIAQLTAERDAAVEEAKKPFDADLIQAAKRLESLVASLKSWALGHRNEWDGRKSYEIAGHFLAFRTSPGKLECSSKDDAVIDAILASDDEELIGLAITVKPALDKKAIKAAIEGRDPELAAKLAELGFHIVKPEEFKFEPARVSAA